MNSQFASLLSITLFSLLFMSTFYSTSLSGLLLLNGLFCFSKKTTEVSLGQNNRAWLSLLITTGFDNDFTMDYKHLCSYGFYGETQSSFYRKNCFREGSLVSCKDEAAVSKNLKTYYSFTLDCNISRDHSGVQLAITPNQVSTPAMHEPMLGSVLFNSKLTSEVCGLNEVFYFYFSLAVISFQALLTVFLFLVNNNRKLSEVSTLNEGFRFLIGPFLRNKIISYCNPFNNSPILLSEDSCDCFSFVKEALDSVDKLWEKDMFYCNSGCSYFTKILENGKRIFLSDDNQGHFVLELNSGTIESSVLCKYLMIKKNKLIINNSGHYPNLSEAYELARRGEVIRVVKSKVTCVTGGKDFNFGLKYFYKFFDRVDKTAVKNIMNGDYRNPNSKIYKNSEWKIFSSDLFFHFGVKPQSKIKKMKPSKTFLSFSESDVELPDQSEEEVFDEICNNLIIFTNSTGRFNGKEGGSLKNNFNRKEGRKNDDIKVDSLSLLKGTIELEEKGHIIGEDYECLVNKGKDYSLRRIRYFDFINRKEISASSLDRDPDFDYNMPRGLFRYGNNFINLNSLIEDHLEEITLLNISYDSNIIRAKPGWVNPSNKNLAFFKRYKKHYDSYEESFKKEKLGELNSQIEKIKWSIERYTGFMEKAKSQGQRKKYADLIKPLMADLEKEEEKANSLKLIGEAPVMEESDYQGILLTSIYSLNKIDRKGNPCLKEEAKEVKKMNINKEIKKWEEAVDGMVRGDKKEKLRKFVNERRSKKEEGKGGSGGGKNKRKGKKPQSTSPTRFIKNEDVLKEITMSEKDFLSEVIKKTMRNCSAKGKRPGVKNVEIFLKTRTREKTFVLGDLKKSCYHYGLFKLAQKIFIRNNSSKKTKSNVCFECQNCLDNIMLMRVKELNNVRRNKFILNLISKFSKRERNSEIAKRIMEMMDTKGFVLKNLADIQNEMMEIMKERVIEELSVLKDQSKDTQEI